MIMLTATRVRKHHELSLSVQVPGIENGIMAFSGIPPHGILPNWITHYPGQQTQGNGLNNRLTPHPDQSGR